MKKQQFNTAQKTVYVLLVVITVLTILNFFTFGYLFAITLGFGGLTQVAICFLSLLVGSITWATLEEANEKYTF